MLVISVCKALLSLLSSHTSIINLFPPAAELSSLGLLQCCPLSSNTRTPSPTSFPHLLHRRPASSWPLNRPCPLPSAFPSCASLHFFARTKRNGEQRVWMKMSKVGYKPNAPRCSVSSRITLTHALSTGAAAESLDQPSTEPGGPPGCLYVLVDSEDEIRADKRTSACWSLSATFRLWRKCAIRGTSGKALSTTGLKVSQ